METYFEGCSNPSEKFIFLSFICIYFKCFLYDSFSLLGNPVLNFVTYMDKFCRFKFIHGDLVLRVLKSKWQVHFSEFRMCYIYCSISYLYLLSSVYLLLFSILYVGLSSCLLYYKYITLCVFLHKMEINLKPIFTVFNGMHLLFMSTCGVLFFLEGGCFGWIYNMFGFIIMWMKLLSDFLFQHLCVIVY